MKTPLSDFISEYNAKCPLRLHMPGHKGRTFLGIEQNDITEIPGADVLYQEDGVLRESQDNATLLFHTKKTLYSTEGSTLCIRAMLYLALQDAKEKNKECVIASPRNAHKAFLSGCALLDIDPVWIEKEGKTGLFDAYLTPDELEHFLAQTETKPSAIYVTSPDYLGNVLDIHSLADISHKHGAILLVDNAHGAYLNFLPESQHPISLGADLVCDSAHKTLPVLTGGAYLHLSENLSEELCSHSSIAMSLFASTSPSYMILSSLDRCNAYLSDNYTVKLNEFLGKIVDFKKELKVKGWQIAGNEPMKVTLSTKARGYLGTEVSDFLFDNGVVTEFSDPDFVVMMLSPEMCDSDLTRILSLLESLPEKDPLLSFCPKFPKTEKALSPREAMFSPCEEVSAENSIGRILASPSVSCPPAIPIVICGERITEDHLPIFRYYNVNKLFVVKEKI